MDGTGALSNLLGEVPSWPMVGLLGFAFTLLNRGIDALLKLRNARTANRAVSAPLAEQEWAPLMGKQREIFEGQIKWLLSRLAESVAKAETLRVDHDALRAEMGQMQTDFTRALAKAEADCDERISRLEAAYRRAGLRGDPPRTATGDEDTPEQGSGEDILNFGSGGDAA